jgi:hypothetical protein
MLNLRVGVGSTRPMSIFCPPPVEQARPRPNTFYRVLAASKVSQDGFWPSAREDAFTVLNDLAEGLPPEGVRRGCAIAGGASSSNRTALRAARRL